MEHASNSISLHLAVEHPDLVEFATEFCDKQLPGISRNLIDLDEFLDRLTFDHPANEMLMLVVGADADDELSPASPMIQQLTSSRVPVLVVRKQADSSVVMSPLKRIVVPLDGSSGSGQAIPLAQKVAAILSLPVRFLMVIDPSRVIPPAYAYDPEAWGIIEELRQTAHWALTQAEQATRAQGLEVGSSLLYGATNASLAAAIEEGDLVVMASHGADRRSRRSVDSVALRVLCAVPEPMIVMRASRQADVIVDGYEACSWVEPLNRKQVWKA